MTEVERLQAELRTAQERVRAAEAKAERLVLGLRACMEELESAVRSEFDGVWAESDFDNMLNVYRSYLPKPPEAVE